MALENLTPAVRVEAILDGADIDPANRLEYFLKQAANEVPKPVGAEDAGKVVTVNSAGNGYELASGGGSSDSGVMIVTVTVEGTGLDSHLVADKTFAEIAAAIQAGKVVFCRNRSFAVDNVFMVIAHTDLTNGIQFEATISGVDVEDEAITDVIEYVSVIRSNNTITQYDVLIWGSAS